MPKDISTTSEITGAAKDSDLQITLEPIRSDGPAAFATHQIHPIKDIALCEVELDSENGHHLVTILRAHNLFGHQDLTGRIPNPIPPHGRIARAIFDYFVEGSEEPRTAELRPPGTVRLQFPADAPFIFAWLNASPFRIARQLARTLAVLLLALATATAPALDDSDGDADDDDGVSDRHTLHLAVRRAFHASRFKPSTPQT